MLASLRSRLVLSNLLIILLGLLAVVVVFTRLLAQRSVDIKRHDLATQSRAIAHEVRGIYAHHGSVQELPKQIYLASRLMGERVVVAAPSGRIVVDSAHQTPFLKSSSFQLNQQALRSGQSVSSLPDCRLVCFQSPIHGTHGHRNGGAVLLVAQPAGLRPSLNTVAGAAIIAIGSALLVWLLMGLYFTFSIFRPLLRITEATHRMAGGDYGVRVRARGRGEMSQLAESFNEMAEQVQRGNQVLRDFLANVSHDLRTPLTMVAGFSQALLDGTARPEAVVPSAGLIHEEALKMQHLVDDLLQLTRLESGLLKLDPHPIEIQPFLQRVVEAVSRAHTPGSIRVNVPGDIPKINVDPERLERALRNLVDNALEYGGPGNSVIVAARRVGNGWIEISVADRGDGIAPEDLPHIFDRFYRSDKSRDRAQGHSGLGLAIVKEIVESHGGQVSVESAPGEGTAFRLTVPEVPPPSGTETRGSRGPLAQPLSPR